jgi:hypothetical protein
MPRHPPRVRLTAWPARRRPEGQGEASMIDGWLIPITPDVPWPQGCTTADVETP